MPNIKTKVHIYYADIFILELCLVYMLGVVWKVHSASGGTNRVVPNPTIRQPDESIGEYEPA